MHYNNALQGLRVYFWDSGINIDDRKWGNMLPLKLHQDLHALGFSDAIEEHLFPTWANGDFVRTTPRRFANFLQNDIQTRPEFSHIFEWAAPATEDYQVYRTGLGRVGVAMGALGLLASLATVSASAQSIGCEMKDFVKDRASGKDDWAYVDALGVRQELNARGAFAGDFAMRAMYWK